MFTISEFAAHLVTMQARIDHKGKAEMTKAVELVKAEAQEAIGTYKYGWPKLADSTIRHKMNGDTPELETGELRDSIQTSVDQNRNSLGQFSGGHSGAVYSDNEKMVWAELGTIHAPPRPILSEAAKAKEKEVVELLGRTAYEAMIGG